ncbi:tryptophanyl-tRNA synthetase [Lepidopterella palustris CBS 459.81]|uniref:tryptophan--tRNA ligase n=1 Tax=Lepidopterella palustris CBS 459.81 TaxID=1314670 RepID=A0A8E2DZS8_9PEZI|nr:tryptophanyl-tRNA synthetase [Lepidopterella palustris CBS 459.81]
MAVPIVQPSADSVLDSFIDGTQASRLDSRLLERFERLTGRKPHRYLRRGIVFCHRDFELILDKYEHGEKIFLKTGRGPSSDSLHIGHSIPFEFTKWLQEAFGAKLVIMLTDDMKLLHSTSLKFQDVRRFLIDNAKDILAFGFPMESTFMFSNLDFVGGAFYENIVAVARHIQVSSIKTALGFNDDNNVGMFYCCSTQSAGAFATSYPGILATDIAELRNMSCLIACSYDIDGYFSEVRKHAHKLGYASPAFLYSSLLPSLQSSQAKMSASVSNSAIYLTDSPSAIQEKLETSVARDLAVAFQYLKFFMEDDDELESLTRRYRAGELSDEDVIKVVVEVVQAYVAEFQSHRGRVTDEFLQGFMEHRLLS